MRQWIYKRWWAALLPMALLLAPAGRAAESSVRAVGMTVARGATNQVSIVLDSLGIENGVELSLCFDPTLLNYVTAVRGIDGPGSTFFANTTQLSSGHLGLFIGLQPGVPFDAGERHIIEVSFRAVAGIPPALTTVSICDLPLGREVVDLEAFPIPAAYSNTTVTILGTCTYSLGTNAAAFDGPGGASTVSVTANDSGCPWPVLNTNSWITITSPTNNTGSATVSFTVSANSVTARTGIVMIAEQQFTVAQSVSTCGYTLSPASRNHGPGAATNTVTLVTSNGCAWTLVNPNDWISFTTPSSGSGSATNTYTVAANPNPVARTGLVQIAGQTLTVSQDPVVCSYSLSPKGRVHGYDATTGSNVIVSTSAGCDWTATTTNGWITLLSGTNGPGNNTLSYGIAANPFALERIGAVFIADQTLVITQRAATCTVSVSPTSASHGTSADSGSFNINVTGGCPWTVSNTNGWLSITTSTSGSGSAILNYSVQANSTVLARSGVIAVTGSSNTVNFTVQQAPSCSFTLSPVTRNHGYGASTGNELKLTTSDGCPWTVVNSNTWITFTTPLSGIATNTVTTNVYTISANPIPVARTGVVQIAGQTVTISQDAALCSYALSPVSRNHGYGASTGNELKLTTSNGCPWTVVNSNTWITFTTPLSGIATNTITTNVYTISANPIPVARTGVVEIAGQTVTISQDAALCSYALSPVSRNHGYGASAGNELKLTTSNGCPWTVVNSNTWITFTTPLSGIATNTITTNVYTISANPIPVARTGVVQIAGQTVTISQDAAVCSYALSPVSRNHGYGASAGNELKLTTSNGCPWTVVNSNTWITFTTPLSGIATNTLTTNVYTISANPNPVARTGVVEIAGQTVTISQDAAVCGYSLSPVSRNHGYGASAGNELKLTTSNGCPWTVVNSNTWITFTTPLSGIATNTVTTNVYTISANPIPVARTGVVEIAGQTVTISQDPAACGYSLSPVSRNHGYGTSAGNELRLTASNGCPWTVVNSNTWITFTTPLSGIATNTVTTNVYTISANPIPVARTGVVEIAGQTVTISQDAALCSYALSPVSRNHGYGASAGNELKLTTSNGCQWTVVNSNTWITFTTPLSGIATNTVTTNVYTISANPIPVARTGVVQIAGQTVTISQDAAVCSYALSPVSRNHGYGASAGNELKLTTSNGCPWTVVNSNTWITFTTPLSGIATNTVTTNVYTISANPNPVARTGVVEIAGQTVTISQDAAVCGYSLSPVSRNHGYGASAGNELKLTTSNGCPWTVVNSNTWITFTTPLSGIATNTVTTNVYTISANPNPVARTGVVEIAGQTVTISQDAAVCGYSLSPVSRNHGYGASAGNELKLTASNGCPWTVVNSNAWITFTTPLSGIATNTVTTNVYTISANPIPVARTGVVEIAGQTVTISQDPAVCSYALSPVSRNHGYGASTGNELKLTTSNGCPWTVVNSNTWIIFTTPLSGIATNTVTTNVYTISANPNPVARTGVVEIAGQTVTISQDAAVCGYSLSPVSRNHGYGASAGNELKLTTSNGCPWTVVNSNTWITFTTPLSGIATNTVTTNVYTISANPNPVARTGIVEIAGQTVTISQDAAVCGYSLSPVSRNHGYGASAGNELKLTTSNGCPWTVVNSNTWITFTTPLSGIATNTVTTNVYTISANPIPVARTGVVEIAGQTVTISQDPAACGYSLSPVSRNHGYGTSAGNELRLTASNGCPWTVVNSNTWITFTTPLSGIATNTVTTNIYTISANPIPVARTGVVEIAGQTVTISQDAAVCGYSLSPVSRNHGYGASAGNELKLTTSNGCPWTVVNSNAWITFTTPLSGIATNTVTTNVYTISANPNPVARTGVVEIAGQTVTISQDAAVCGYSLSPVSRNHGYGASAGNELRLTTSNGCPWMVVNSNTWITFTTPLSGIATNTVTTNVYTISANPNPVARTGVVEIAGQTVTISQDAAVCGYSLSPVSRNHGYGASAGNELKLTASNGCPWTVVNSNAWITFTTPLSGIATNTVTTNVYTISANPIPVARTGVVEIAGQTVTISQDAAVCGYSLSPVSRNHGYGASAGNELRLTTSNGCPWTVVNSNTWITFTTPLSGIATNTVTTNVYTISANPIPVARTGVVEIAGQTVTISQDAALCSYALSPVSRNHGYGASAGNELKLTTSNGCPWTVVNSNTWITFTTPLSGIATNTVTTNVYTISANPNPVARTGVVQIAGQTVTISQDAVECSYSLSPKSRAHGSSATNNTVVVTTSAGCDWTATTTNSWISLLSGTNGPGSATLSYAIAANPDALERIGAVLIADQSLVITQRAATCTVSLSPTNSASYGSNTASGSFAINIAGGCSWTVGNTNAWITLTSPTSGSGNGAVSYSVDANATTPARSGIVTVTSPTNTVNYTVNQAGVPCGFAIAPTTRSHGAGAESNSVGVITISGCAWTAANTNDWIHIITGVNGNGTGTVNYSVDANPTIVPRSGTFIIAGEIFNVTQQGAACTYRLSPTNRTHGSGDVTGSVAVTALAGCAWSVVTTDDWITITSALNGTGSSNLSYSVAANSNLVARTGLVMVADQTLTLVQQAAVCTFSVSPTNRTHGNGSVTGSVSVTTLAGCAWSAVTSNDWINFLTSTNVTGSGSVTYMVETNQSLFWRTGVLVIADRIVTLAQRPTPCTYLLSPSNAVHSAGGEIGFVTITAPGVCPWMVESTNDWITLMPDFAGSGNGNFSYEVAANPLISSRTGHVTVADQILTVSQAGAACGYSISPSGRNHNSGAATGTVSVTTLDGCNWTVANTNSWISIVPVSSGSGNGSVTYTLDANVTAIPRTGVVTIASQPFTLTQSGAACTYAITPTNRTHGAGIETGSVDVIALAGCAWTVGNTNSWIAITSGTNGSGSGAVVYTVASNGTVLARSGLVTVAGQSFTVNQDGACAFVIAPASRSYGAGPTNGTVAVTTAAGCGWTTVNTNIWISLTSGTSGTGTGVVAFTVVSNATAILRSGVVTIAGQPFTVSQAGATCTYAISPTNRAYGANATNGTVAVTTLDGCDWTVSNTNTWITINSGSNGTGSGTVDFSVAASQTAFARTGVVLIATRSLTLTQTGATCTYALALTNRTHGAGVETGSVDVTTFTGCAWTVSNTNSWVTITSGTNGSGGGTVVYTVASNGTAAARGGVITIAGRSFAVNQDGAACSFVIAPTSRSYSFVATNGSVNVTSLVGCAWTARTTNTWITITSSTNGSGNGTVSYTVASNATSLARAGGLTIANQDFTVTQSGAPCTFSISVTNRSYGAGATNGTVAVTALDGCTWGTVNTNIWILLTANTNGNGAGSVDFSVAANPTALARTGVVVIANQSLTVSQTGATCTYALTLTNRTHGAGIETGTVDVTTITGCAWTVSNTNSWVTITSGTNGSGGGTVVYTVASNGTALARSGVITIAGRSFAVNQDGAACTYSLSPTFRTHTSGAETSTVNVVTLTGCPWSVNITNSWILIVSSGSGTGAGTFTYAVTANPSSTGRTGVVDISGQNFTVTQLGAPCTASLSPVSWVHHATAESGMVSVTIPGGCVWSAANTNSWITITAGASGTGSGTVTYSIAANTGVSERTGVMTIAGQSFAISQVSTSCTFKISPTNRFHGSGTASNTVSVTAGNGCSWSVINTNPWVTILSNATGSGSAVIGYSVSSNRSPVLRSGVLNIAGEFLTLTQWGTNCGLALTPSSRAHGSVSETGVVTVTTSTSNCTWSATTTNTWITINTGASGTGNGSLGYTVAANTGSGTRLGVIAVNGEIFSVSQTGQPCTFAILPANRSHGSGSENGSVSVTAGGGCAWSTVNTNGWINITSGASGSGDGTVNYTIDANPAGLSRAGVVIIAGQSFTLSQAGAACVFTLSPTSQSQVSGGGTGLVTVTTIPGCSWTADNTNSWILITSAADGTGSGSVGYSVDANNSSIARTGLVTIAGRTLTVTQAGLACTFSISPAGRSHGGGAETGLVAVTSVAGCAWTVLNTNAWITFGAGTNGVGSGSVGYALASNSSIIARTGIVVIAGQAFAVTQAAVSCSYSLVPTSRSHGSGVESGTVGVAAPSGCSWAVSNTNNWIQITSGASGNGSGTVGYSIEANPATTPRSGTLTVMGQNFTLTQAGLICSYALSPTGRAHGPGAETGTLDITTSAGCAWTVLNTNGWITINSGASGNGSGTVDYSVALNTGLPRSGNLVIGGQVFAVSQTTGLRLLRVIDTSIAVGQTNRMLVVLDSAGDESGVGFSVCYNTNLLTFIKAVRGREATNASAILNVNTSSTNRGRLGLAMALGFPQVFLPGSNAVVEVFFRAAPGTNAVTTAVSLCDLPIPREIVDVEANAVPASYADGTVTVFGICTYALSAGSASMLETGGNGSVGVISGGGCAWTVSNTNTWIAITSGAGGSGNGTVNFTVSPNGGTTSRTGLVVIAGQNFTVSQSAVPCSYVLVPTEQSPGAGAQTGSISLTTLAGCAWTVSATTNWITIISPTNGVGSATIDYSVSANPSSVGRTGTVLVAGQTFTVRQAGAPCAYAINPLSRAHGSAAETGLITVTAAAGCPWVVINGNSWVTITSGATGSGNGSVGYSVAFNPNLTGRTGVVSVAGQTFTVTQAGNPCAVTLSPASAAHISGGGTGLVSVAAAGGCAWTVGNTNSWITITSSTNGTGNGSFGYSVASNPGGTARTGLIAVSGRLFSVDQAGAPCIYAMAPGERAHGSGSEGGLVSVATFSGCAWTASTTNVWITILSPTNSTVGSGSVSYTVSANPSGVGRTGIVVIADMTFTVSQAGAPCSYSIAPASRNHGVGVESGSVTLNSVIGCPWSVFNSNAWITITSATNGTGPGGVNYTVTNNPAGLSRTGVVSVAGQAFTVIQAAAPCTFAISPTNRVHGSGATNNTVTVTTLAGCTWSVANANPWISIQSALNNTGPGAVTYSVEENTTAFGRTGTVTIAGLTLTLAQSGAACTYAISPTNRTHGYAATTNTVNVTSVTGCPWTISNTNPWISMLSGTNGTGSVSVTYAVANNTAGFGRTGLVAIAGQTLTLVQTGAPCVYVLAPAAASHTAQSQTGLVTVTAALGCGWTVNNTNSWITITSSTNGSGAGAVSYLVATNASPLDRVGLVGIADQIFTVSQAGFVCSFTLDPTNASLVSSNITGLVNVTTSPSCNWTIINTNTWIAIKSPATESGTGPGLVRFTAAANPNPSVRMGTLVIGGVPFTVSQLGTPCIYSLSPTNRLHGSGTETNSINVLTVNECSWTAVSTNPWITILSGTNGSGNSLVNYFIDANPASLDRTGFVMVAGMSFPVTQLGAVCLYSLTSSNTAYSPASSTGSVTVTATPGCTWAVVNSNSWITITSGATGTNNGLVKYSVAANFAPALRSGFLRIGGQVISITQTGIVCSFAITPTNRVHGPAPETNQVSVLTSNLCPWTVSNTNAWITILSPTSSSGNSNVTYSVALNLSPVARTGQFTVAGLTYTVAQAGIICSFTLAPTSGVHSAAVETGQISVITSNICPWTVSNTNSWITILSSTNVTGSSTVLYSVATNTSVIARTGQITVAGQTYSVTQAGFICTFALNPPTRAHSFNAATGLVTVTTGNGCAWTLSSSNDWISFLGATNRTNGGFVSYVLGANPGIPARTGVVSIAGQPFTVTQYGTAFIAPTNKTVPCGTAWAFNPPQLSGTCAETNFTLIILSTVTNAGCGSAFNAVRRWDAFDGCSNRLTMTQTVSVVVTVPPLFTCPGPKTVECGSAWSFDTPTAIESCGGTGVTLLILETVTNNVGACGGTYAATRTWQATDSCTNTSTCSQTVRLIDSTPPVLTCPVNKTVSCSTIWNFDTPAATDGCEGTNVILQVVTTVTNAAGLCGGTFIATRTWEAIDGCTNRSTCSQTVTVTDTTPPSLTCAGNKAVECGLGWSFDMPVAIDGCVGTNVTLRIVSTVTNVSGACGNTLSATRTWEALDSCSNRSTCAQTVTVVDTTSPTLACPASKTMEFGAAWSFDAPSVADSCSTTGLTLVAVSTVTNTSGSCGRTYTATRTWQALDGCSNRSASCSQVVLVIDTTPPLLICQSDKLVACGTAWAFDAATATDLADGTNVVITVVSTLTNSAGACGGTLTATRTWQVTDACSNSAMCSQTVRVIDATPPTLTCAPNKTVPCGTPWNFDAPTTTDSCSGTNVTLQVVSTVTNAAGLCSGTLTATRTWQATDGCTNTSTCSQTVTVIDVTPPVLTCAGNKVVECGLAWTFDPPVASDSCVGTNVTLRIVSTVTNAPGACANTLTAMRTWEALDGCSNRSTCVQTVMVVDTTPPTLVCPATKTAEFGTAWSFDAPVVTDSCGPTGLTLAVVSTVTNTVGSCGRTYTVTRTWQALDGCSNRSATCSQLLRVIDTTRPVLTCQPDKLVICGSAWTFDAPTAIDSADGTNVIIAIVTTLTNGTCASGYSATRFWQAIDGCSNRSAICSQSVSAINQASIAGTVSYYPTNYPTPVPNSKRLSPVSISLTGGANMTTQTAPDGSYSLTVGAGDTYTVTPRLTNSNPLVNGVSTLDISLIRRHILNIANLDSPYKLLAGDVNGSRSVTTLDISLIRRVILGVTNTFPMGLWRFVPSDYVFPDPLNPWDAPTNHSYTNLVMPLTNQDFMGIKIGDVNNSWVPPVSLGGFAPAAAPRAAALAFAPEVTFAVSRHTNQPGDTVVAQVTASGFRDVTSAQWTLAWDPGVLRYKGTGKYGLKGLVAGNFGTSLIDSGRLTFSWDDPDALGVTTADGSTVFAANFEVIGAGGTVSPLVLSGSATETEVGVNFSEANLRVLSGLVTVIGPAGELPVQPRLASVVFTNGLFGVPQQTVPGRRYILEYTDTLPTTNWTPLPPIMGDGSVLILTDPGAAARQRFYRLRIE